MNTVTITGRFTADPEMKITSGQGKAVTTVRVAINEQGRDKTVFIDLQSWEKTAEFIASYGTKGRLFEATARLALDQWTDTEGGQHSKHYLVTGPYQFRFLDKLHRAPTSPRPQPKMAEPRAEERGTLRGPPLFRQCRRWSQGAQVADARESPRPLCRSRRAGKYAASWQAPQRPSGASEALTVAPLMAVRTKERGHARHL